MKAGDKIELRDDPHDYVIVKCLSTERAIVKNIWSDEKFEINVSQVKPPSDSGYREINWGPDW